MFQGDKWGNLPEFSLGTLVARHVSLEDLIVVCRSRTSPSFFRSFAHVQSRSTFVVLFPQSRLAQCFVHCKIQAPTLNVFQRGNFSSNASNSSVLSRAPANTSHTTLASAWLSGVLSVTTSRGHYSLSASHLGPFHHSSTTSTLLPRLPRSAGFSSLVT